MKKLVIIRPPVDRRPLCDDEIDALNQRLAALSSSDDPAKVLLLHPDWGYEIVEADEVEVRVGA